MDIATMAKTKYLTQALFEAHNREIATTEYYHTILVVDVLLGPIPQLIGLTLASLAQQRQDRLIAIIESLK